MLPFIHGPSSTKNHTKEQDPEMHQIKTGNQWYFWIKVQIGVDSLTKLIRSMAATVENVRDSPDVSQVVALPGDLGLGSFCLWRAM